LLKKIDAVFSGARYDPQDVKVLFSPITYVVFRAYGGKVCLLSVQAADKATERFHQSIDHAVVHGNYDFRVLRVDRQGNVSSDRSDESMNPPAFA
jgi:predicted Holliday junction resolvase-like endonuclease